MLRGIPHPATQEQAEVPFNGISAFRNLSLQGPQAGRSVHWCSAEGEGSSEREKHPQRLLPAPLLLPISFCGFAPLLAGRLFARVLGFLFWLFVDRKRRQTNVAV